MSDSFGDVADSAAGVPHRNGDVSGPIGDVPVSRPRDFESCRPFAAKVRRIERRIDDVRSVGIMFPGHRDAASFERVPL
jgi:hypothetical protein